MFYAIELSLCLDIDGDCLADRFVISKDPTTNQTQYELLINGKTNGYKYNKNSGPTLLPPGAGQISFADFGMRRI